MKPSASTMARFCSSLRRLHSRSLLHTSPSRPNHQPPPEEMDFMRAANILFSETPKRKKFGLDFHLWQFFVACLPSFAVYLTAQYARYEIRRMEKERGMSGVENAEAEVAEDSVAASKELVYGSPQKSVSSQESPPSVPADKGGVSQLKGDSPVLANPSELQALKDRLNAMEEKVREMELTRAKNESATTGAAEKKGSTTEKHEDSVKAVEPSAKAPHSVSHKKEEREGEKDVQGPKQSKNEGNPEMVSNGKRETC